MYHTVRIIDCYVGWVRFVLVNSMEQGVKLMSKLLMHCKRLGRKCKPSTTQQESGRNYSFDECIKLEVRYNTV